MIDREIHLARALLVDSNPLLRSVAAAQLRDLGVGQVTQSARIRDARLLLERERFDIVLCNREFEDSQESGQDLLDELRRENLLPHATVFLMVTSQATYAQVVEAGEAALDAILVRPFTAGALAERLTEARNRKRELADVLRALDAGETETAMARAVKRFQDRRPYWSYCGRLAAELLLTLQRPQDAQTLFERLLKARPKAAWARVGLARSRMAQGELPTAKTVLSTLLAEEPDAADAHDLLGMILVEQCEFEAALREYRAAAELTPGCLLRTQHVGALAFYQGSNAEALKWLERSLNLGTQSKLFDFLSLLLIAMLRFDLGQASGVAAMQVQMRRQCEQFPASQRLRRMGQACDALVALLGGQADAAQRSLMALADEAMAADFDLEVANIVLALWARWPAPQRPALEHQQLVERIGQRFCSSKAIAEVLIASARREAAAVAAIRKAQVWISTQTEQAMERVLRGEAEEAARSLLSQGEQCLNAKLLEMAGLIAGRHRASIPDAQAIANQAASILQQNCRVQNHIAGLQRSGRSPGGLQLRGVKCAEPAPSEAG